MAEPSFSIVIPTRERPHYLAACVESIAGLDYPSGYQVIIVLDGAQPGTEAVVREWRARLDLQVIAQPQRGAAAARNRGAREAQGEMLAFTDDDCAPDARWLMALAAVAAEAPGAMLGGRTVNGAPLNPYSVASQTVLDAVHLYFNGDGRHPRFFASNNLACPTEGFNSVGGFDETFPYAEDRELCHRWQRTGLAMRPAPDAVVHHLRQLDLRGFVRQHRGYGVGAYHFHRARGTPRSMRRAIETDFYRILLDQVRDQGGTVGRSSIGALVLLSQTANTLGFAVEMVRQTRRARAASP
jgi:glycosyltransferase involved in cell wall biosynthesis